jgi:hypothetical protein
VKEGELRFWKGKYKVTIMSERKGTFGNQGYFYRVRSEEPNPEWGFGSQFFAFATDLWGKKRLSGKKTT